MIETLRPKYACRACEKNNTTTPIVIAPMPAGPIPKSMVTPSLLAHIIGNKYQLALPLYRQEIVFKQLNIDLNTKIMEGEICGESVAFSVATKSAIRRGMNGYI